MFSLALSGSNSTLNGYKFNHPNLSDNQLWSMFESGKKEPDKDSQRMVDPSIIPNTDFKSEEKCPKCGQYTITILEEQTGGLDEGSKQVINCLTCNYLSKSR